MLVPFCLCRNAYNGLCKYTKIPSKGNAAFICSIFMQNAIVFIAFIKVQINVSEKELKECRKTSKHDCSGYHFFLNRPFHISCQSAEKKSENRILSQKNRPWTELLTHTTKKRKQLYSPNIQKIFYRCWFLEAFIMSLNNYPLILEVTVFSEVKKIKNWRNAYPSTKRVSFATHARKAGNY